jgi:Asp-tRNA(Asn)/Glu-tRNA(Gln) amidotransferase A subunit family amidase
MTNLIDLSISSAAKAIATGEITSEDLTRACLARIDVRERDVKAFVYLDREHALAQAREADVRRRDGRGIGPLHGVPIAIKDIVDTADMPTECGSPAFAGWRPETDAQLVANLRAAGAVILGKTVTTELATLTPGMTRNPRNLAHTPGGSSSGSAAAVADHMVPGAIATQTGGSVIRPASFCGIHGFKPTFGTISRTGVLMQAPTLDTVGVYGRSVEDLALFTDAIAGADTRDPATFIGSRPKLAPIAAGEPPVAPLFAFMKQSAWDDPGTPAMREAFGELCETLGDRVEEVSLDHTIGEGLTAARLLNDRELAQNYGPLHDRQPGVLSDRLAAQIARGRAVSDADYAAAREARERMYGHIEDALRSYGTILTPASPGAAPHGLGSTGDAAFNAFWTFMGTPAVTLPLFDVDGLPMGVQLVGARGDDGRLLRTARWLERHLAALV